MNTHIRPGRRRGFTMPEMVVAVAIMVVVTAAVAGLFVQVRKMVGITQWAAETRSQVRATVENLSRDLQNMDDAGYLLMLNRDYVWDANPAVRRAAVLYPGDDQDPRVYQQNKAFWADRLAFIAQGPFNNLNFNSATGNAPPIGSSARVYYGHSLWTHELADAAWMTLPGFPVTALGTLTPSLSPVQWTGGLPARPAVNWILVRQAVLQVEQAADADFNRDTEFQVLDPTLGMYTYPELSRWIDGNLTLSATSPGTPGTYDWLAMLRAPRVFKLQEDGPPVASFDPTLHQRNEPEFVRNFDTTTIGASPAPARVLLPHTARLRFQVRLSDGTIIPKIDERLGTDPGLRGQIEAVYPTSGTSIRGLDPSNQLILFPPAAPALGFDLPAPRVGPVIPVKQTAYVWTPSKTNIRWFDPSQAAVAALSGKTATQDLYPVAVRIHAEVYDLERRTPDPIVVDEWLPIRWNARPRH